MPYAQLPRHGDVLHDCHAEVLVRRALRAWLLERLVLEHQSQAEEVDGLPRLFTPTMTHDHAPVRWRLSDQARIHLYISTPPCGEASSCLLHARNAMQDELTGHTPQTAAHAAGSLLRGRETSSTQGMLLRTKPGRRLAAGDQHVVLGQGAPVEFAGNSRRFALAVARAGVLC